MLNVTLLLDLMPHNVIADDTSSMHTSCPSWICSLQWHVYDADALHDTCVGLATNDWVQVGGIYLSRKQQHTSALATDTSLHHYLQTPALEQTLRAAAMALSSQQPLLLEGPPGIQHVACKHMTGQAGLGQQRQDMIWMLARMKLCLVDNAAYTVYMFSTAMAHTGSYWHGWVDMLDMLFCAMQTVARQPWWKS